MPRVIQFFYPCRQPEPSDSVKPWNRQGRTRSFLVVSGVTRRRPSEAGSRRARLGAWGEWEAPALAIRTGAPVAPFAFEPCLPTYPLRLEPGERAVGRAGEPPPPLQDTDPFIFDGPFLYSTCKQVKKGGAPTKLRELERGDVVLFGSKLDGGFALDKVFVVASSTRYRPSTALSDLRHRVPRSFVEATLKPLAAKRWFPGKAGGMFACPTEFGEADEAAACGAPSGEGYDTELRLYWGATPEEPVNGLFSFVPARDMARSVEPFPSPRLDFPFLSSSLDRAWRDLSSAISARRAWELVVDRVLSSGLELGTSFSSAREPCAP